MLQKEAAKAKSCHVEFSLIFKQWPGKFTVSGIPIILPVLAPDGLERA